MSDSERRQAHRAARRIWQEIHGPIPPGHHIHHDDRDWRNNNPENLVCLPGTYHLEEHANERFADPEERARQQAWLEEIRPLAAEWHDSPAGRSWHRTHAQDVWIQLDTIDKTCAQCGGIYATKDRRASARFCSNACKAAARRASGADDIDRVCPGCGMAFRSSKYLRQKYCTQDCARAHRAVRELVCAHCGQSFTTKNQRADVKYCSTACYRAGHHALYVAARDADRDRHRALADPPSGL